MNRTEFEALRDMTGKRVIGDIRLAQSRATHPLMVAENIRIENADGVDLRMSVTHNPEIGSTTVNVHVPGTGPVCRLDIDGPAHRPAGRCHKHSLQSERCPSRNLPDDVADRGDLSGKSAREVFEAFCAMARIVHEGTFVEPGIGSRGVSEMRVEGGAG
jgi:hypothetical protein